jgi:hypothetical protein
MQDYCLRVDPELNLVSSVTPVILGASHARRVLVMLTLAAGF